MSVNQEQGGVGGKKKIGVDKGGFIEGRGRKRTSYGRAPERGRDRVWSGPSVKTSEKINLEL